MTVPMRLTQVKPAKVDLPFNRAADSCVLLLNECEILLNRWRDMRFGLAAKLKFAQLINSGRYLQSPDNETVGRRCDGHDSLSR